MTILFKANGRCAGAVIMPPVQPITAGSVGIWTAFELSPDYDNLVVTAVFKSQTAKRDVLLSADRAPVGIPWEVLAAPSLSFEIGVVGANGDGTVVIPTLWAKVGRIERAAEASGIGPEDPSADIGAQIVEQARQSAADAEAAQQAAEAAAEHYPQIINGNWYVWDVAGGEYIDSGVSATGPQGPPGASGTDTYVFNQTNPADVWHVVHNLGKYPSVSVVDTAGSVFHGAVKYLDKNSLMISFAADVAGMAYLN